MRKHSGIINKKFEMLTVIRYADPFSSEYFICRCECGTEKRIRVYPLLNKTTRSCGCLRRNGVAAKNRTHGLAGTPAHRSWKAMLTRCTNSKNHKFPSYGGRGIKICDRWMKFENFYADMGDRPQGTTLDRIDVDGDYTPDNCQWATADQQRFNKRGSSYVEAFGCRMNVGRWAKMTGIHPGTIRDRINRGWHPVRALTP